MEAPLYSAHVSCAHMEEELVSVGGLWKGAVSLGEVGEL